MAGVISKPVACSLDIVDESSQHAGHAGSRMSAGANGETNFNVKVVSAAFEGQNTVKRHRQIYGVSNTCTRCCCPNVPQHVNELLHLHAVDCRLLDELHDDISMNALLLPAAIARGAAGQRACAVFDHPHARRGGF
jgi:BolA-like protein